MKEKLQAVKFEKCGCNLSCNFIKVSFNRKSREMQNGALARGLAKGVTYHPVISDQGLMEFSRSSMGYTIKDIENSVACSPCEDGVRAVFGKHPLKRGESITFYLQEA